jgi:asparagine synthase (glutamine-hydrolysing)
MEPKFLLKEAFRDVLPTTIVDRPKQPYMAPDLIAFIRNGAPTEIAANFLNSNRIKEFGLFDPKMVERLLFKHNRRQSRDIGYRDNMLISYILSAQMVEYWIRNPKKKSLHEKQLKVRVIE